MSSERTIKFDWHCGICSVNGVVVGAIIYGIEDRVHGMYLFKKEIPLEKGISVSEEMAQQIIEYAFYAWFTTIKEAY